MSKINRKLTVAEVSSSFLTELGVTYSDSGEPGTFVNKPLDFTAQDIVAVISASGDDKIGAALSRAKSIRYFLANRLAS
ncbi:hypothetical protein OH492_29520 [Vibrio chagasii]|nr:hypothetical protein [Vibrio chagasii]